MNHTLGTAPDRILSKQAVARWLGVSPSSIDRWTAAGSFPEKRRLGPARVGWAQSAVEAWLAAR